MDAVRTREGGREGETDREAERDSGQNVNPGVDSGLFCERGSAPELKLIIHLRASKFLGSGNHSMAPCL